MNTHWLVLTSTDWEDALLLSYAQGNFDWLTPRYHAVRDQLAPGDGVIFVHGRTRLAHIVGTVTSYPEFVVGRVEWRNGRVLDDREWWDWTAVDFSADGVDLTGAEDERIRHPENRFGGQNGWMAPVPPAMFRRLAARIASAS